MESKKILNILVDSDMLDFIKMCEDDLAKPDNELLSYVLYQIIGLLKEDMSKQDKEIFAQKLDSHLTIEDIQKYKEEHDMLCKLIEDLNKETNGYCGYEDYKQFYEKKILPIKHELFEKTFEKLHPSMVWERFYCRADKNVEWKDMAEALEENPKALVLDLYYMMEYLSYEKSMHDYDNFVDGNISVDNY